MSGSNVISKSYAAKIIVDYSKQYSTTYGFEWAGNNSSASNTAEECYSTLADTEGTACSNYQRAAVYNSSKSRGVTGMTSDALIEAVLATGGYEVKATVNDGYP